MEKLDGKTFDVVNDNIGKLKELFPEVATEGKIDFEKLQQVLGENVEKSKERYDFTWNGKSEAVQLAQKQTTGTLRPCKEESINWDSTSNLYIEGDNLEVLRVLQNSYRNKVKVIYIDPPYNTGKDFVYKDNFEDNIKNYKEKNLESNKSNPETNGRYHTDWLNMMYPRLKLARNFLKDNGLIFVSISDREFSNLKKICDEIYGEDNFLATLIWDRNHSAQAGIFKVYHEYILVYSKNSNLVEVPKSLDQGNFEAGAMKKESSRHPMKDFTFPKGTKFDASDGTELKGEWGGTEKVILKEGRMICENGKLKEDVTLRAAYTQYEQMEKFFYGDKDKLIDSRGQRVVDFYFNASGKIKIVKKRGVITPQTTQKFGTQGNASLQLSKLFDMNDSPIDSPKPVKLNKDLLGWFVDENDLVLDFFSGSATLAQAVLEFNAENNKNVKYILVQLNEEIKKNTEAYEKGYRTICDIGKDRINRTSQKLNNTSIDVGYKVFKLDETNLLTWDSNSTNVEQDLMSLVNPLKDGRTQEDVVYEVLLKYGVDLSVPIKEKKIEGKTIYDIGVGYLFICLEKNLELNIIEEIAKVKPTRVVFYDESFKNDTVRTNAQQILKRYDVEDIRVI